MCELLAVVVRGCTWWKKKDSTNFGGPNDSRRIVVVVVYLAMTYTTLAVVPAGILAKTLGSFAVGVVRGRKIPWYYQIHQLLRTNNTTVLLLLPMSEK